MTSFRIVHSCDATQEHLYNLLNANEGNFLPRAACCMLHDDETCSNRDTSTSILLSSVRTFALPLLLH